MVTVTNYNDTHFYPQGVKGLEELILFPDGEYKREDVPNSSIWVFPAGTPYQQWIFGNDTGCGMTALIIKEVDVQESADRIAEHLHGKNILGRGNHFVDICSAIDYKNGEKQPPYHILLVHTDGKQKIQTPPANLTEAVQRVKNAEKFREELGHELAQLIGSRSEVLGNWTHNTVEEDNGKVIYRKGIIKVKGNGVYILPSNLGAKILFYAANPDNLPPHSSMPHATGRCAPRGEMKVSVEEAKEVRKLAYIPEIVCDSSLRTEHPSCYNSFDKIFDKLGKHMVPVGETRILAYVGKI